jgi:hypothetical protein
LSLKINDVQESLPDGSMQYLLLDMWSAWRAAAFLYGTCMPSRKGAWHKLIEEDIREARHFGTNANVTDPIPEIVRQYNLQNMHPCQAQRELFNYARIITMRVRVVFDASPTASAQSSRRADDSASTDQSDAVAGNGGAAGTKLKQVEGQAQELPSQLDKLAGASNTDGGGTPVSLEGEWAFPKQGMQGRYSGQTKGVIYDLGNAIFAGHMKLDTNQGTLPIVLVVFGVPVPRSEMSDGDLALVVASKVASLPERVADTIMNRADSGEYRFRNTSGKVIGVTIAYDRKTAIARLLSSQ